MAKRIVSAMNQIGASLVEMIAALLVFATITTAAASVFVPMLFSYMRAIELAEVNTLLDNISAFILDDISSATTITSIPASPTSFTITTSYDIVYDVVGGILYRGALGGDNVQVIDEGYYRGKTIRVECEVNSDVVTITLTLREAEGRWEVTRVYASRPIGMG